MTIEANRRKGGHFFDPKTMRAFQSRVLDTVYEGPGGIFFVTSERVDTGPRFYKVRHFYPDTGGITTYQGYSKGIVRLADAKALAETAAATAG